MEMINGKLLKDMLASGANNLSNKFTEIDALNVFPVPDGDTGTNMSLTFNAGVKDALACTSDDVCDIAKVLSIANSLLSPSNKSALFIIIPASLFIFPPVLTGQFSPETVSYHTSFLVEGSLHMQFQYT